jgi:hypothetical protein
MQPRRIILGILVLAMGVLTSVPASAIVITSFGPFGEAGTFQEPDRILSIGSGGDVFELDSFLILGGLGLLLSTDPLPAGLDFVFGYGLSDGDTDLTLAYTFTNNTGAILDDVRFISYLDAEIIEPMNTFYNEYGQVVGSPGTGPGDPDPDSWEIDEPGINLPNPGDIYHHAFEGELDGSAALPGGAVDDVAMALGFFLGPLDPGGSVSIRVLLSEDMDRVGTLALLQRDADLTDQVITMSGQVAPTAVPEPGTLGLLGLAAALLALARRNGPRAS